VEQAVRVRRRQALGRLEDVVGGHARRHPLLALDQLLQRLALDQRPGQVVHAARRAHVHERHHRRVPALLEGPHLAPGDADVPHAAPGEDLDGVALVVVLVHRLVDRAHAARAEGVHQGVRPEHEALRFTLQQPLGLELRQDALADQVGGQRRRLGPGVLAEELADHLVELAAVDQVATAQVPDEPFTRSEFSADHEYGILL
jgi:hypothetical protein